MNQNVCCFGLRILWGTSILELELLILFFFRFSTKIPFQFKADCWHFRNFFKFPTKTYFEFVQLNCFLLRLSTNKCLLFLLEISNQNIFSIMLLLEMNVQLSKISTLELTVLTKHLAKHKLAQHFESNGWCFRSNKLNKFIKS